jgi:outer membrane protein OmpA-like peptidoglycan-associated protein
MFLLVRTNITERKYSNALQNQIEITERKNDSLLTLIKLNEAQKDLIQTNINAITLKLNFNVGKAIIIEDSTTIAELNRLIEQIKSFDGDILSIVIEHSASPEGNLQTNMDLAHRRADAVNAFLRPYLGDISTSVSVKMHTWFDVANLLCKEGFIEESNAVAQAIVDSKGSISQQGNLLINLKM